MIAMKSGDMESELLSSERALKVLQSELMRKEQFVLPGTDLERCTLLFKVKGEIPKTYPRKAGVPIKEPL